MGVRAAAVEHDVYRQVISFGGEMSGERRGDRFHDGRRVADDMILPGDDGMIRRQVVGVAAHRERLLAAGSTSSAACCSTGRRATGKTHTVRS